jgi:N-acetylglucosamine kinase-like BadF-type ATPase
MSAHAGPTTIGDLMRDAVAGAVTDFIASLERRMDEVCGVARKTTAPASQPTTFPRVDHALHRKILRAMGEGNATAQSIGKSIGRSSKACAGALKAMERHGLVRNMGGSPLVWMERSLPAVPGVEAPIEVDVPITRKQEPPDPYDVRVTPKRAGAGAGAELRKQVFNAIARGDSPREYLIKLTGAKPAAVDWQLTWLRTHGKIVQVGGKFNRKWMLTTEARAALGKETIDD